MNAAAKWKNDSPRIGALLLAAGDSSRMGGANKLLISHRGKPLICHAAQTLNNALQEKIVHCARIICGRDSKKIIHAIANANIPRELCILNAKYKNGIASSLQCGLRAMHSENADGALILLGDMPRVSLADIRAIANAFAKTNADIVAPICEGRRGNPVLFSAKLFAKVMQLRGDIGARTLFARHAVVETQASAGVLFDIDSPADLESNKTNELENAQ